MRKGTMAFAAATALLIAMGTNPNIGEHQKKITSVLTKIADAGEDDGLFAQYNSYNGGSDAITQRQIDIASKTIEDVSSKFFDTSLKTALNVTDYLFCSVGELDLSKLGIDSKEIDDNNQIVSLGILGHVFTINNGTLADIIVNN